MNIFNLEDSWFLSDEGLHLNSSLTDHSRKTNSCIFCRDWGLVSSHKTVLKTPFVSREAKRNKSKSTSHTHTHTLLKPRYQLW